MSPSFLKSHLDRPPPGEPGRHLGGLVVRLGAEESPRLPPPGRVAHDDPATRQRHLTRSVPWGPTAGQLRGMPRAVGPGHLGRRPRGCRVAEHRMELGRGRPDLARSPHRPGRPRGCLVVQAGLPGQRRDQSHPPLPARSAQRDDAAGRVAQQRRIGPGQPASQQASDQRGTPRQGLEPPLLLPVGPPRGGQLAQHGRRPVPPGPGDRSAARTTARRAAPTVRRPRAGRAPAMSVGMRFQVGREDSGRKRSRTARMTSGRRMARVARAERCRVQTPVYRTPAMPSPHPQTREVELGTRMVARRTIPVRVPPQTNSARPGQLDGRRDQTRIGPRSAATS